MAMTTAIIGLGIMGRRMLEHMQQHGGFAPDLLWDPDPAACKEALKLRPAARIMDSAQDAIQAADLVYLACPPGPRKSLALLAADLGKAVFLEKPLGIDIAASRDLVAKMTGSGVPAAVNFTQAAGPALNDAVAAAQSGAMGELIGADIILTYAHWPRAWQKSADWLRFRAEGGMVREVVSHFLFFSERVLGPLRLDWARPGFPADDRLCETHMQARLTTAKGQVVSVLAAIGGAQPDRQELTIKGSKTSRRISDFYQDAVSDGGAFVPVPIQGDPRGVNLQAQLGDLLRLIQRRPNRLATLDEALRVQILVEGMLAGKAVR